MEMLWLEAVGSLVLQFSLLLHFYFLCFSVVRRLGSFWFGWSLFSQSFFEKFLVLLQFGSGLVHFNFLLGSDDLRLRFVLNFVFNLNVGVVVDNRESLWHESINFLILLVEVFHLLIAVINRGEGSFGVSFELSELELLPGFLNFFASCLNLWEVLSLVK